MRTAVRTG